MTAPSAASAATPLLEVRDLRTWFHTERGVAKAVDGITFTIQAGRTLAVVGESGCGKTVTALSILGLVPVPPAKYESGQILLDGVDLLKMSPAELRKIRGGRIAMVFQEPAASLNPVFTIGDQLAEAIRLHRKVPESKMTEEILAALKAVQVSDPERRLKQYPHEMSGGMKQRVMIAMALACHPELLVADEPTTAVDVTIQARILDLLRDLQRTRQMSILLITHDLGVVAELADDVVVMYAGQIIEQGPVQELFARPRHPYTLGLFASLPRIDQADELLQAIPGSVPAATDFPKGCRFRDRCPFAAEVCLQEPVLVTVGEGHRAACLRLKEIEGLPFRPREERPVSSAAGSP